MENKWYCASYFETADGDCPDNDFFVATNDEEAVEFAKDMAKDSDFELLQVTRIDPDLDWDEVETIWY